MADLSKYEDWGETVLFDIFREAETRLGGWLLAEQDKAEAAGDAAAAAAWEAEAFAVARRMEAIRVQDRAEQIEAMEDWNARRQAIDAGAGPLPSRQ